MRILCLDIGTVRIGVAVSDERGVIATPLETVSAKPRGEAIERIVDHIESYNVDVVVVGLPLDLDGRVGRAARRTRAVVAELAGQFAGDIVEWDERMTSVVAERALIESGVRREKRKGVVDQVAATLILQSYLGARGESPSG